MAGSKPRNQLSKRAGNSSAISNPTRTSGKSTPLTSNPSSPRATPPINITNISTSTTTNPSHPAHVLLSRAHSPTTSQTIFTEKIRNKPLLLHPTSSTTSTQKPTSSNIPSDKRSLRRHIRQHRQAYHLRKRKPRPLSAREKRQMGVYSLNKNEIKFEIYRGLNRLWNGYMCEILGITGPSTHQNSNSTPQNKNNPKNQTKPSTKTPGPVSTLKTNQLPSPPKFTPQSHGSILAGADYHGAYLEVTRSPDVGKVGLRGVVVRDTKFTFVLVTPDDQVKIVPKRNTVFRAVVRVDGLDDDTKREGRGLMQQHQQHHQQQERQQKQNSVEMDIDNIHTSNDDTTWNEPTPTKFIFEIHGNQVEFRAPERASRKFKWRSMEYL